MKRIFAVIVFLSLNVVSSQICASQNEAQIILSYKENRYSLPNEIAGQSKYVQQEIARSGLTMPVKVKDSFDIDMNLFVKAVNAFSKNKDLRGKALLDAVEKDLANFDPNVVMKASELLQFEPGIELAARTIARSLKNPNIKLSPMQFYSPSTVEKIVKYYYLLNRYYWLLDRYYWLLDRKDLPDFAGLLLDEHLDYNSIGVRTGGELNLSNLNLREITGTSLSLIPRIEDAEILVLENNKLKTIAAGTFNRMPKLKQIFLNGNQLQTIEANAFIGNPHLKSLNLSRNQLTSLPKGLFISNPLLKDLDLSRNLLSNLKTNTFEGITNLEILNLSRNQLSSLPQGFFKNFPILEYLNLDNNRFQEIDFSEFDHLQKLIVLSLNNNQLSRLKGQFNEKPQKQYIFLHDNALQVIDPAIFKNAIKSLEVITVENNPLTLQSKLSLLNAKLPLRTY